jgi:hypothetical protein
VIGAVVRGAWSRLVRKQFLFLYPFVLGLLESLAFLPIYSVSGGTMGWSSFAAANAAPWTWIQEHSDRLLDSPLAIAVTVVVGVGICVLSAALRAPLFRAIAGPGYPRAPRSVAEWLRLSLFYILFYGLLYLVPFSFAAESPLFQVALFAATVVAILLVYADYAVVFEDLLPLPAARRSLGLLRRSWPIAVAFFLLAQFLWTGLALIYERYYEAGNPIFPLLPVSQILLGALIVTVFDVLFIILYGALVREAA